tara:strand:+ start:41 stop:562 length:522 start_codon:yes stop_codon:yes gene_type:complete
MAEWKKPHLSNWLLPDKYLDERGFWIKTPPDLVEAQRLDWWPRTPVPDRPAGFFMDLEKPRSLYGRDYSRFGASAPEMEKHEALIRRIGLKHSNPAHVERANDAFVKSLLKRQMQRQTFKPPMSGLLKYTPVPQSDEDIERQIKKRLGVDARTKLGGAPARFTGLLSYIPRAR